jgi:hypothetical protein
MKKILTLLLLLPFLSIAQVGVNTTAPKAALDVESTNNGVLIPRVQLTSILDNSTIVNPNAGPLETSTLVYNIAPAGVVPNNVVAGFYYWNGSQWTAIAGNSIENWSLNGNAGTTPPTQLNTTFTPAENFIGTTDNQKLFFGTNNISRMNISGLGAVSIGEEPFFLHLNKLQIRSNDFNTSCMMNYQFNNHFGTTIVNHPATNTFETFTQSSSATIWKNTQILARGSNSGTNIGIEVAASAAINNYAIIVPSFGGTVGIGTSTPSTKLHIENTTSGAIRIVDGTQAAGRVLTSDASGVGTWQTPSSLSSWSLLGNSALSTPATPVTYGTSLIGGTENFIGTTNANDLTVGTDRIERMRVKNTTGFVGIGTANPSTPLEVATNGTNEFRLSSRGAFGTSRFSMISDKELATEWRPTYIESGDNGSFTGRMDFYTNGTGIANRFGSVRAMSIVNGNVGVGIINPTEKLHVFSDANQNKASVFGYAQQTTTGVDYDNIGVKGIGRGIPGWGFGAGVMGIGETTNSYFATGVYAHLGTSTPLLPLTNQALYANGNNIGNSGIFIGGNVGIGTPTPNNLLHINSTTSGAVRIVDGTQANGRVLTSNATGVATWQNPTPSGFTHYLGELYLGGIIFELYKGSDGLEHGLIVSLTESGLIAWQTATSITGANRSEDGAYNTALMTSSPVATYIASLGTGWYLPSIDELNILFNNRYYANKALRLGGYPLLSISRLYWSSTELDIASARALNFGLGTFYYETKSDTNYARAIRQF